VGVAAVGSTLTFTKSAIGETEEALHAPLLSGQAFLSRSEHVFVMTSLYDASAE
jgi:hypothetical protein